jgi:WhiB family transcriptional regulator, redox-sensing transcriptional regulator
MRTTLSGHLTRSAQTLCQHLPPATESAWQWQENGNCRQCPPDLFFPDEMPGSRRLAQEIAAKKICQQCPVLEQCRSHALKTPELHGIWGAMTARERTRIRLRPHRAR